LINRNLYQHLLDWKNAASRKPLILRGARQVGKTTLVDFFGKEFDQYLYFNLEKKADNDLFNGIKDLGSTVELLFLAKGKINTSEKSTLLFIDEVQEKPEIIEALRYFFEEYPHLHIIVSGSLLEFALEKVEKTPVGRVEYAELHPLNFREFLFANNDTAILNVLDSVPIKNELLLGPIYQKFHTYAMIGGMPNIVDTFLKENSLSRVLNLYASIVTSYKADVEKYAKNNTQRMVIRHVIDTAPFEIDNRIKLANFGNSSFKSREVKEAIAALEKAKILELIYPTVHTSLPSSPDFNKSPRLTFLDIGLVNYQLGLHKELLQIKDLNDSSRGKLVQQIVVQELKSIIYLPSNKLTFWVRDENGTSSEIDLVYPYKNKLIPIEIKSGKTGKLRSLHEFMERCEHGYAVRFYAGKISVDTLKTTKGKEYKLLNLPYFLATSLDVYLDWFMDK
jgi:uncharacterized protein